MHRWNVFNWQMKSKLITNKKNHAKDNPAVSYYKTNVVICRALTIYYRQRYCVYFYIVCTWKKIQTQAPYFCVNGALFSVVVYLLGDSSTRHFLHPCINMAVAIKYFTSFLASVVCYLIPSERLVSLSCIMNYEGDFCSLAASWSIIACTWPPKSYHHVITFCLFSPRIMLLLIFYVTAIIIMWSAGNVLYNFIHSFICSVCLFGFHSTYNASRFYFI